MGVAVLLSCWSFEVRCLVLDPAGCCVGLGLGVDVDTSGSTHADYYSVDRGTLWQSSVLDSVPPPQRPRPNPWPGNQESTSCTVQHERKERKNMERKKVKIKESKQMNKTQDK